MQSPSLSILIPLYNEEEFISTLLERVFAAPLPGDMPREVVIVDDCSTDGSVDTVEAFIAKHPEVRIHFLRHDHNQGKGAAIRTAIKHASCEFTLIQDADLEYDPREYPKLLGPLLAGQADAVYGSRFLVAGERRVLYYWHSLANHILTTICNIAADVNLTDMETCYKAFRTSLLKTIPIRNNRFGIEPEITVKLARRHARIYETPISYHGRTYEEGKKIGLKDAFEAVWVILQSRFTRSIYTEPGPQILDAFTLAPRFNRWMADTILPFLGDRVLEIGAGTGNLTRLLAPRRKFYAATDIDTEYIERLRNGFRYRPNIEVRRCDIQNDEDLAQFAGCIDTIVFLNVLEHIEDDLGSLRRLHNILPAGGRLIVLVPHDQAIFGTLDTALGHFRRYSREEFRARLEQAGFTIEHMVDFNRIARPGWYINGRVLKTQRLARMPLRIFNSLVWLWRRVDSSLPWPPTSLIAIAVKAQNKP